MLRKVSPTGHFKTITVCPFRGGFPTESRCSAVNKIVNSVKPGLNGLFTIVKRIQSLIFSCLGYPCDISRG